MLTNEPEYPYYGPTSIQKTFLLNQMETIACQTNTILNIEIFMYLHQINFVQYLFPISDKMMTILSTFSYQKHAPPKQILLLFF